MKPYAITGRTRLVNQSLLTKVGIVLSANLLLIAAAKTRVCLGYVDLSLQSLIVPMLALVMGRQLAIAAVSLYLLEGLIGVPVFQGTPERGIGLAYMVGPTGGYLLGFLGVQILAGVENLNQGMWSSHVRLFAVLTRNHVIIHVLGIAWLSVLFGMNTAIAIDMPLWPAAVAKIVIGFAFINMLRQHVGSRT